MAARPVRRRHRGHGLARRHADGTAALAAWRASASTPRSLFAGDDTDAAYEALLALTVGELRAQLGVPDEGLVKSRALHAQAPTPITGTSNALPAPAPVNARDH